MITESGVTRDTDLNQHGMPALNLSLSASTAVRTAAAAS